MTTLIQSAAVQALAWTLVHFLWQGAAIALVAFALTRGGKFSAHARYTTGVAALAAMLLVPMFTFARLINDSSASRPASAASVIGRPAATSARIAQQAADAPIAPGAVSPSSATLTPAVILALWVTGVSLLSLRLFGGWIVTRRMARHEIRPATAEVQALVRRTAGRLSLDRVVRVFESSAVAVPVMIGWMRPVVLLPASALSGLSFAQIEAVVAHELAHIRRHDYLVNLLQSAVETLLFYHPAVWWMSRRVRADREHCCDDIAVGVCDRVVYATALTSLAAMTTTSRLALGATDGPLLNRVRRILGQPIEGDSGTGWVPALLLVLVVGSTLPVTLASARNAEPRIDQRAVVAAPAPQETVNPTVASTVAPVAPAEVGEQRAVVELPKPVQENDDAQREFIQGRARLLALDADQIALQKQYEQAMRQLVGEPGRAAAVAALEQQLAEIKQRYASQLAEFETQLTWKERQRPELAAQAESRVRDAQSAEMDQVRQALKMLTEAQASKEAHDHSLALVNADAEQARAKLDLDQAKIELARRVELVRKGLAQQEEVNRARSELARSEINVKAAEERAMLEAQMAEQIRERLSEVSPKVVEQLPLSPQAAAVRDRVLSNGPMADDALIAVLKDAAKLSSDAERANVLIAIARRQALTPEMASLYVAAAKSIRSEDDRGRVFAQLLRLRQVR